MTDIGCYAYKGRVWKDDKRAFMHRSSGSSAITGIDDLILLISPAATASRKCANRSASFELRRIEGKDIGTGLIALSAFPPDSAEGLWG